MRCSTQELLNTTTSSLYALAKLKQSHSTWLIILWNVAGTLGSPNGITSNSYSPNLSCKCCLVPGPFVHRYLPVAFCQIQDRYGFRRTYSVNQFLNPGHRICIKSSHFVQLSIIYTKPYTSILFVPSTIGEAQGLVDGLITLAFNIWSSSCFTNSL